MSKPVKIATVIPVRGSAKRRRCSCGGEPPFVWKLWSFTFGEVWPDKGTPLLVAARPSAR